MIVTCGECRTKYVLDDIKVPDKGIRVRCPKCRFVWRLSKPVQEPDFEINRSMYSSEPAITEPQRAGWAAGEGNVAAVMSEPLAVESKEKCVIAESEPEPEAEIQETPQQKKDRERSKRLARVFVSDILVYNQEKRDQALLDGNLMTVLGSEIKKSWEAYKEKVGPDVVESNNYFRNALNDILADGQKVF